MTDLERVTVNLIPKASRALRETSELLEMSKTDVVNRALQMYGYMERTMAAGGRFIVETDGNPEVIRFL